MEIFVSTINDSQPLNVVTKNFVLDVTCVLDPHDTLQIRLSIDLNQPEPVFSSRCFTLPASPVQSSKIILEQCSNFIPLKTKVKDSTDFNRLLSVRALLFEVSCKSISRKPLSSLSIKIEYCLGGVCLMQSSWHLLFLFNNRGSHQRPALQIWVLTILAKPLIKQVKEVFS